jgi:hypothetical protein
MYSRRSSSARIDQAILEEKKSESANNEPWGAVHVDSETLTV